LFSFHAAFEAAPMTSVYTDLSGTRCRTRENNPETGSSVRQCPGAGGYQLLVADDDERRSVTVVSPDHTEHPLAYWQVVTRAFSSLGKQAEWRVVKHREQLKPVAFIVRVNAPPQEDPGHPQALSYLAVAKMAPDAICVTDKIRSGRRANEHARHAADRIAPKACLTP
jgi:hypothetical protein